MFIENLDAYNYKEKLKKGKGQRKNLRKFYFHFKFSSYQIEIISLLRVGLEWFH